MARDEVVDKERAAKAKVVATRMVEVWASTVDALLQDWLEKGANEDRLGTALVSAKLAQVGNMMTKYFKSVAEDFCEGSTELKAANQAVSQVDAMVRTAMTAAGVGMPLSEEKPRKGDTTLN